MSACLYTRQMHVEWWSDGGGQMEWSIIAGKIAAKTEQEAHVADGSSFQGRAI